MNYQIKNEYLTVTLSDKGAEIKSIIYQNDEYMHDSNPKYWNRSAPLLFPNIGAIKNNKTIINGKEYNLGKHGIIRDYMYQVKEQKQNKIVFNAKASEETMKVYPFMFELEITYELVQNKLNSYIQITNHNDNVMPFNFGLHPAFKVPHHENEKFSDYKLVFGKEGTYEMPTINLNDGTIDFTKRYRTFTSLKTLPLSYDDYLYDALIFENLNTNNVTLTNKDATHGVKFTFKGFPMLGIWTPDHKDAPFICLEPWMGCGDRPDTDGNFESKRDLMHLNAHAQTTISYSFEIF